MPYMSSVPPGADYYKVMREQVAPVTAAIRARTAAARTTQSALQQRLQAQALGTAGMGAGAAPAGLLGEGIPTPPILPGVIPAVAAGLTQAGVPGWAVGLGGVVAGGLGLATMFGMKFPWETPPGEGFIAPWTGEEEIGPGLWGRTGVDYPGILEGFIVGQVAPFGKSVIVKVWNTNPEAPQYGQAFAMDAEGYIYTTKKNGVVKRWKPAKHLVIPTNINKLPVGRLVRAERVIDRLMRKVARRSPSLKLAK